MTTHYPGDQEPRTGENSTVRRTRTLIIFTAIPLLIVLLFAIGQLAGTGRGHVVAEGLGTPGYLPITSFMPTNTPVPTPTTAPLPQVVGNVPLPAARCPNDIQVNLLSGYAYVSNNGNDTMSIVQELNHINTLNTGEWPSRIGVDLNTTRAFLANLRDTEVAVYDMSSYVTSLPTFGETFNVIYNPVNNYIYASDLYSHITIFDATTLAQVGEVDLLVGWALGMAVDTNTGYVYVAGWELGKVFILSDTAVIGEIQAGWGILELAVDPNTGYVYGAHSAPNEQYPHNISVMKDGQLVTTFTTADRAMDVAVDPNTGIAYFANADNDTVTLVQGTNLIGTISVGDYPWSVAVNTNNGYVFVANRNTNDVTVIKDGAVVETLPAGLEPFSVAVDTARDITYVANRASRFVCNEFDQCETTCDPFASVTVIK